MSDCATSRKKPQPTIRIDQVHWLGQTWFEASILFPDSKASSTYPKETFAEAERAAYRIIADNLLLNFTPCDSYELGAGVVESKIVKFDPEKLTFCCPLKLDCTTCIGVKFPCPNFITCRRALGAMSAQSDERFRGRYSVPKLSH